MQQQPKPKADITAVAAPQDVAPPTANDEQEATGSEHHHAAPATGEVKTKRKRVIITEEKKPLGKLPILPPPWSKRQRREKCMNKAHKSKKKGKCRVCGICVYCPPRSEVCKTLHKRLGQIGRRPADDEMSLQGGKKKRMKTALSPTEVGELIRESQRHVENQLLEGISSGTSAYNISGEPGARNVPTDQHPTAAVTVPSNSPSTMPIVSQLQQQQHPVPVQASSLVHGPPSGIPGSSSQVGSSSTVSAQLEPTADGESVKYSILSTAAGPRLQSAVYREAMLIVTQALGLPAGGMLVSSGGTSDSAIYRCKARVFEIFQAVLRIFFMGKPPPEQILGELSLLMWKRYDGREYQDSKRTEKANAALIELIKHGHPSIKKFCLSVLCTAHTREELNVMLPEEHYVGKVAFHARRSEYKNYQKGEQLKVKGDRSNKPRKAGESGTSILEMDV